MKISNTAFNYDQGHLQYSTCRLTEPAIAAHINIALGDAQTVLNIGAGAGSYEPSDRYVVSVEPSVAMRTQRLALQKNPVVIATSDNLPFDDHSFDAATAFLTIHHWPDIKKRLEELRRVIKSHNNNLVTDPSMGAWIQFFAKPHISCRNFLW